MTLKKLLLTLSILLLSLTACSRATEATPTVGVAYPIPEQEVVQQPVAYPDPSESPNGAVNPGLNPEIYPAPGKATIFDPVAEDADLVRSAVELIPDSVQIILDESPVVFLRMTVQVVDLCQQVRVVINPPQDGKINTEIYSVAEQDNACAQVVTTIVPTVTLGALEAGNYELLINGEAAGSFEVQAVGP